MALPVGLYLHIPFLAQEDQPRFIFLSNESLFEMTHSWIFQPQEMEFFSRFQIHLDMKRGLGTGTRAGYSRQFLPGR